MQRESAQALDGSKIGKVAVNTTGCLNGIGVGSMGRDSSVGTATRYGLDGSGFALRWRKRFETIKTGPGAHPMGTGS